MEEVRDVEKHHGNTARYRQTKGLPSKGPGNKVTLDQSFWMLWIEDTPGNRKVSGTQGRSRKKKEPNVGQKPQQEQQKRQHTPSADDNCNFKNIRKNQRALYILNSPGNREMKTET